MIFIKQVIAIIIIYLQVADVDAILMSGVFLDSSKDVTQTSGDDTPVSIPLGSSCHRKSFTRACLAVRENGTVEAF